jgi:hypothetical protein
MSTAGTYNYHPKVAHPNQVFYQMESTALQTPFFFGGSQVPINLNLSHQNEMHTPYVSHKAIQDAMPVQGRGIHTTAQKSHKIYLSKHIKR